jgi:hypothetical protein
MPRTMNRRSSLLVVAGAMLLAACAAPRQVTLSEGDLQRAAERRFPVERRYLEVFDVTLARPRLALSAADNRVASTFDVVVRERVLGARWAGTMVLKSALRYAPSDHTVRLQAVRVEDFALDGSGGVAPVERLGALVAERLLEDAVVYTLPAERVAQLQRAGLRPSSVAVTPAGVEIRFTELPR